MRRMFVGCEAGRVFVQVDLEEDIYSTWDYG